MPSHLAIEQAMEIRIIENTFLDLFSKGMLNGTVHTSVGQEFSAVAFAGQLQDSDFVVSNHRCHGHYLAFTGDARGLIAELLGKVSGTCAGIGSSQHLQRGNFFSNGIQGGIMPVAAGLAMTRKLNQSEAIVVVFIGDGTLGEGVVYETLNLIALWSLPLLVVCENNRYAQSTQIEQNLAGSILARAAAFGIQTFESFTSDPDSLIENARLSIDLVRHQGKPAFHIVNTYRLNPHSKGDDDRDPVEIEHFRGEDFLCRYEKENPTAFRQLQSEITVKIDNLIAEVLLEGELSMDTYLATPAVTTAERRWRPLLTTHERQVTLINRFLKKWLEDDSRHLLIGEDILSPYGGAFKVSRDLSFLFPDQVWSSPISEAAITGIGNGLALAGYRPMVEIMFGDFITLALDQIINHASKFFHMYNRQVQCPLIVRTPMGGRRGYGPTHSQTLDRFLIGIDNLKTVALNVMVDPSLIYQSITTEKHPVIVIENKADYGKIVAPPKITNFVAEISSTPYPVIRVRPERSKPTITLVTYGGMAGIVVECIMPLFRNFELKAELLVLSCICPIDYAEILESVKKTRRLVVIEEGSVIGGIGSEIISTVLERVGVGVQTLKIGAHPVPVPSVRSIEDQVLPSQESILRAIAKRFV